MTTLERRGAVVGGVIGWLASVYIGISVGVVPPIVGDISGSRPYLGLRLMTMFEGYLDEVRSVRPVELDDGFV